MPRTEEEIVIFCTVPNRVEGEKIAKELVELRLAACVNMVEGVTSYYNWKGEVHQDPELLLVIKSLQARFPELESKIRQLHNYEAPEIIALPIVAGSEDYLEWLAMEVKSK